MASSYEMFLKTIRTSSPREQEEVWKSLLLRTYPHERATMLKQMLTFMERQDPEGLRAAIREYKAQRDARLNSSISGGVASDSSNSDSGGIDPHERARPYASPTWEGR